MAVPATHRACQIVYFIAFMLMALALGPSLAHLFELPNKIALSRDAYFSVQQIYNGWALFGFVIIPLLLVTFFLAILLRSKRRAMLFAWLAFACILATQIIFWSFTFPVNVATVNWSQMPDNWESLRTQWEYSHAAAALFDLGAMAALVGSVLSFETE